MKVSISRLAGLVLLVAFGVRMAAVIWWQDRFAAHGFVFPDSESYWQLAKTIAQGPAYEMPNGDRIFRTPGYPLLLAPLFWLHEQPPIWWARMISVVCGTLTVSTMHQWARRVLPEQSALLAMLMAACYPGAIAMSVFVLTEAPFCLLMIYQLALWCHIFRCPPSTTDSKSGLGCTSAAVWRDALSRDSVLRALGVGGLAGIATLIRPSWLLFWPFAIPICWCLWPQRRTVVICGACVGLAMAAVMTPWWLRNYGITKCFVPTSLQVGASLYDGLRPDATGESDMQFVAGFRTAQAEADARAVADGETLVSTFEYRVDRRHRDAAIVWAKQHPHRVGELAILKFRRMWNLWPNEAMFRSIWIRWAVAAGYAPLLVLAIRGCWIACRNASSTTKHLALVCVLPAIYFTLLHVVFVASIRYRDPAMFPLMLLAALAITGPRSEQ